MTCTWTRLRVCISASGVIWFKIFLEWSGNIISKGYVRLISKWSFGVYMEG